MNTTIIIPTYKRPHLAESLISRLLTDNDNIFQLVVVSQGTEKLSVYDSRLQQIQLKRPNLPAARNAGIALSQGDIILFLDDDVLPMQHIARQHIAIHKQMPEIAAIAGRVIDANNRGIRNSIVCFDQKSMNYVVDFGLDREELVESMCGAHMSFKRYIFDNFLFDPWYIGNSHFEEVDLAIRMGRKNHKILFSSRVWVDHILEKNGGCRSESSPSQFWFNHFRNTALCFAKNFFLSDASFFLKKQKYDLEYFSRKDNKHDLSIVAFAIIGIIKGLTLGIIRRYFGNSKYR